MKKRSIFINLSLVALVVVLFLFVFDFSSFKAAAGAIGAFSGAMISLVVVKALKRS